MTVDKDYMMPWSTSWSFLATLNKFKPAFINKKISNNTFKADDWVSNICYHKRYGPRPR